MKKNQNEKIFLYKNKANINSNKYMELISTEDNIIDSPKFFSLNNSYQLCLNYSDQSIIVNNEFVNKIKNHLNVPEFISIENIDNLYYRLFLPNKMEIELFMFPVLCKFNNGYKIDVFSNIHLKLLLEEFIYIVPSYFSKREEKYFIIDKNNIKATDIIGNKEIDIIEKNDFQFIKDVHDILDYLLRTYNYKTVLNDKDFTIEFLSQNYNKYFSYEKNIDLSQKFIYINSNERIVFINDFNKFMNKIDEKIFAVCGPHGIGKSISALYIQKLLFYKGISSLYINLKYYRYKPLINWEEQRKVLITECFFLIKEQKQFYELSDILLTKCTDIDDALICINNYILSNKINVLLIIDQYQKKYDSKGILLKLINFNKIFILSSINDKDIKRNIKLKLLKESMLMDERIEKQINQEPFFYNYYEYLVDKNMYKNLFKETLSEKIKELKNNKNNNNKINISDDNEEKNKKYNFIKILELYESLGQRKFEKVKKILEKFNNIPKYYFSYFVIYDSIFDLVNNEFKKIFIKLNDLSFDGLINIIEMNNLKKAKSFVDKEDALEIKYIDLKNFIEDIDFIPLKYINYKKIDNNKFYFYSAFPLFSKIFDEYYNYVNSINIYNANIINGSVIGTEFESILKIKLRVFSEFNIDGYLEVKNIKKMKLTEEYEMLSSNYLRNKNNILINQINHNGEDFDFAIYKSKENKLILLQSKYRINSKLLKARSEFVSSVKSTLNNFNKLFNLNVSDTFLLYISSYEYNIEKEEEVFINLEKNKINCLFYSLNKNEYYFNFEDPIKEIICQDSFKILPKMGNYIPQKSENESESINKKPKNLVCLGKKTKNPIRLDEIYNDFIFYTKKNSSIKKEILKNLGDIKKIYSFGEYIPFDYERQYAIISSLNKEMKIDVKQPIGFIYYNEKNNYLMDITKKKNYQDYDIFLKNFDCSIKLFVGDKINKK